LVYAVARTLVKPLLLGWFRLQRSGSPDATPAGPLIIAANHRSVLDPLIVGVLVDRPVYFMGKKELFRRRPFAWLLSALGAFPVDRGGGDRDAIDLAEHILRRGDCLVIFPEGRCMPPGPLGAPRRGVGRLAQATGASVLPIAISGTEPTNTRRVLPDRIRVHVGAPLSFHPDRRATGHDARLATERIWSAVTAAFDLISKSRPEAERDLSRDRAGRAAAAGARRRRRRAAVDAPSP
jgi:1-acyl-sn-glycerol-3-phosphate acyltransferase